MHETFYDSQAYFRQIFPLVLNGCFYDFYHRAVLICNLIADYCES